MGQKKFRKRNDSMLHKWLLGIENTTNNQFFGKILRNIFFTKLAINQVHDRTPRPIQSYIWYLQSILYNLDTKCGNEIMLPNLPWTPIKQYLKEVTLLSTHNVGNCSSFILQPHHSYSTVQQGQNWFYCLAVQSVQCLLWSIASQA